MTQESSDKGGFQVVEGGSDDPFSQKGASQTASEEAKDNPTTDRPPEGSQPGAGTTAEGGSAAPEKEEVTPTAEEQAALVAALKAQGWVQGEDIQERISKAQSGWDSQNARLTAQLKGQGEQHSKDLADMRRQINVARIEGLPEEERERANALFENEEEKRRQTELAQANDDYFKTVRAYDLSVRFASFWPGDDEAAKRTACEAELMACEDTDQMAVLANEKKAAHYEALAEGGPSPTGDSKTPAGSKASTDAGGTPPPPKEQKPLTGQSMDDLAANVKGLFGRAGSLA